MHNFKICALIILIAFSTSTFEVWSAKEDKYGLRSNPSSTSAFVKTVYDGNYHQITKLPASKNVLGELKQARPYMNTDNSGIFNVLKYGAKADGLTDDSKAFQSAWAAACRRQASTILIPSGHTFLVHPISFLGRDCKTNIIFQLDGNIIAPVDPKVWAQGISQWISFQYINGLTIRGKGLFDGRSSRKKSHSTYNAVDETELRSALSEVSTTNKLMNHTPEAKLHISTRAHAVFFFQSKNVNVTGITIKNSRLFHLTFLKSSAINIFDMSISSPKDHPNTDGIHLEYAKDVTIFRTNISAGDDCVSIQRGTSNVIISNVNCGPGHGISIGGLKTNACVSDIKVMDSTIQNTLFGLRIKTWQGGSGLVQRVIYSNIKIIAVAYPIMINQYYYHQVKPRNQTSAVAISNIKFKGVRGTYTESPVHLACSDTIPCTDLHLSGIKLKPVHKIAKPYCWKANGVGDAKNVPYINCLGKINRLTNLTMTCSA